MSTLLDAIVERYHDWLTEDAPDGVFKKTDVWDALQAEIVEMLRAAVNDGDRGKADVDAIAYAAFSRADDRLTDLGDKMIRLGARGEDILPLDRLESLVALGSGHRVKFGDMRAEEYRRADERHYGNVRDVQAAYDEWRAAFRPYLPGLDRGLSVREINRDMEN